MIQITNPAACCGCTACASVCSKNAITMVPDALGFLYPRVNADLCNQCGACERVCAFHANYDKSLNLEAPVPYGVRHKDVHEIETSRSGAAFIALSDVILERGGVVYGAGYADHFRVVHKRAASKAERDEFKGSKYVQSDLSGVFRQVKADLRNGLPVVFSGTPCQTAGLASFVGRRLRERLFLIDIVCHGVPSPSVWKDYVAYLEKVNGVTFTAANFRDKSKFGWVAHRESFQGPGVDKSYQTFTYLFSRSIMLRRSCDVCYYTNLKRPSDITIADFWGWEKTDPSFNQDNKGCSLVMCNTQKGMDWFEGIKERVHIRPTAIEKCMQPNLQHPTRISPQRDDFEADYRKHGFVYVARRYGDLGFRYRYAQCITNIKKVIKKFIKKL